MTHWLIPANTKFYDVIAAFAAPTTYWPISTKLAVGDVVYIYLAAPYQQIAFACEVLEIGLDQAALMDELRPYFKGNQAPVKKPKLFMQLRTLSRFELDKASLLSFQHLKTNGLNGMLMGARKLENNPALFAYIQQHVG